MHSKSARFDAICEPFGRWLIWDSFSDRPAEFNGVALVGLVRGEARSLCGLLNFGTVSLARRETRRPAPATLCTRDAHF